MSNSTKRNNFITPENAASLIPIFIASLISILLIIFFVIPKYIKSTKVNLELIELIKKKEDLVNIKSEYETINKKFNKLTLEKESIIELISGTSNLDTLFTKFGEIGEKYEIKFISIILKNIINSEENSSDQKTTKNNNRNKKKVNLITDPLLVEGTKKYIIEFTIKTNFINLLSFLREIEFQDNIILFENMNVEYNDRAKEANQKDNLNVKFTMNIYGKI